MQIGGMYTIDFARVSKIPKFEVTIKNGDSKRTIKLILLKNSEVLNLNNYTIVVAAKKIDGKDIFNYVKTIDAESGICEVEITEQMLALDMDLPCEIVLYNADGVVASSSNFVISKISSLKNEETIVSSNEFTALKKALSRVQYLDNSIYDLKTKKSDKQYVDELVASKQLVGAGIDTSVLVFKSDYEPMKNIVEGCTIRENEYSRRDTKSTLGTINTTEYGEDENGYLTVNHTFTESQTNTVVHYIDKYNASQIDKILVKVEFDSSMKNAFVGLGTTFNWNSMNKVMASSGKEVSLEFDPKNMPTYSDSAKCELFVGTTEGNHNLQFKLFYEIYMKSDVKMHAFKSDYANKSEESNLSDYAKSSGGGLIPFNKITKRYSTTFITKEGLNYILEKQPGSTVNGYYYTFYVRLDFDKLEYLNKNLNINLRHISGVEPVGYIVPEHDNDWNPNNKPIPVNLKKSINVYQSIMSMSQDYIDKYINRNHLCILIGYQFQSTEDAIANGTKTIISPILDDDDSIVMASHIKSTLHHEILKDTFEYTKDNIHKIPIGVRRQSIDKYSVRLNSPDAPIVLTENGAYVNLKKENPAAGTKYAGVYIRFDYANFDDLDGEFQVEYINNGGAIIPSQTCILYEISDWGQGSSQGVINFNLNKKYNLKELLDVQDINYKNKNKFYITILKYSPNGVDGTLDWNIKVTFKPSKTEDVIATDMSNDMAERLKSEIIELINSSINPKEGYITCWGDSLTAGGGWTTTLQNLTGLTVYNGGTGGENSKTIMARQGGDIMTINNLTIPANIEPITIATRSGDGGIPTYFGNKVTPLLQGGAHVNPCYIEGVRGTLRWTGSAHDDMTGTWTFTRSEAGELVTINRPTAIRTDFDINKNSPKIMILFIGQNGGYDNFEHLIQQHRLMIEHSKCEDFIVLGLSSGTASSRKEYEDAMRKEFGRRFISLREYLSQYGLADAGIEPTEQDISMMSQGQTPQSLLVDSVHYNNSCKTLIGNMIFKKIKELNML